MILRHVTPDTVAQCAATLRAGGLVGVPTETVYGLGADADNAAAVAQIFVAKGRPADHPLIVHVSAQDGGMSAVAHFAAQVPPFAQQLMSAFWPGPLTLILPRRDGVATAAAGGQASIGLRCPAHPAAQAVLRALRDAAPAGQQPVWGIAAPSANRFGRVSPTTADHVDSELGPDLLVLDGGPCALGIESTIIDCTRGAPVLLRPGSISRVQVEQACGQAVLSNEELLTQQRRGLGACLPFGVDSENQPQRGQFLPNLQTHSPAMGQKGGEKWTAAVDLQPTIPKSDRLLEAPKASGTLESHYAPDAKLRLMDAKALQTAVNLMGEVLAPGAHAQAAPTIAVYARTALNKVPMSILLRRMPDDATTTAHQLFAALRGFDDAGVKLIWVETPPDTLEWEGVRDRLQRASAK